MQEVLERLAAASIELLPLVEIERHWVFAREGFVVLVERTPEGGFGRSGSAGLWTDRGMAPLITRGDRKLFVAKGFEQAASDEQIAAMRRFASDLDAALQTKA